MNYLAKKNFELSITNDVTETRYRFVNNNSFLFENRSVLTSDPFQFSYTFSYTFILMKIYCKKDNVFNTVPWCNG